MATKIVPYKISIPSEDIDRLNQKLDTARIPDGAAENGFERGPPLRNIRRLVDHWRNNFSWRAFEERLNQLPHYEATVAVDGFDPIQVHFIHQKSPSPDAIPLLFVHGWPGHFNEVSKILPLLTADNPVSFHVVAPSLPNFGFSGRVDKPGFGLKQYAETCHKLMLSLGYETYASQGGDWGSSTTRMMGVMYPQHLRAIHLNFIISKPPPVIAPVAYLRHLITHHLNLYNRAEAASLQLSQSFEGKENGYFEIQRQRPVTIGIALEDSPVALLAWIYEKLFVWTDEYPWTDDEVCEWISLYWFSRAGPGASVVIYHEVLKEGIDAISTLFTAGTKVGFSYFPKELLRTPNNWNRQLGDVVFEREHERGGHFAAWEQPEAIAKDLRDMFVKGGKARGALKR